jgi:hypothetical protein
MMADHGSRGLNIQVSSSILSLTNREESDGQFIRAGVLGVLSKPVTFFSGNVLVKTWPLEQRPGAERRRQRRVE